MYGPKPSTIHFGNVERWGLVGGEAIDVEPFQNDEISMTNMLSIQCWDDLRQQFKCKDVTRGGGQHGPKQGTKANVWEVRKEDRWPQL